MTDRKGKAPKYMPRFLRRLAKHIHLMIAGHIFNWPWRSRLERRKVRYKATQNSAFRYLRYYIPAIEAIQPSSISSASEPERAFTIWFQGEDNAPEIVKSCIRSMRRNLMQEVVVLDENSLFDWINLPQYIIDKWKSGKMRAAHFCDICRVELLYRHGGIWLDSTDYVSSPVPQWIMDEDFFIYMSGEKIRGAYSFIQNCFFRARKGNPLLGVWRDAIFKYWEEENSVINYFTHQLLFKLCVENNAVAAENFAKMPKEVQDPTHTLWDSHKDDVFDEAKFNELVAGAFFQKTNYKTMSAKTPVAGTIADYIINVK